ncbi:hypothetical protein BACI348_40496 [Bacillus altitudinis]|uniref:Uncharacterized protein n=1 Tax=Bacillus altitudinis TaxID=293387 RepID=A0A653PUT4_BACAB|nr:hypothetical protein BACI348_40496 [Bacillus altitudinis]
MRMIFVYTYAGKGDLASLYT